MKYRIEISKSAEKELKDLETEIALRIGKKLLKLGDNPHTRQTKKLGSSGFFRIKIGEYRAIYSVDGKSRKVVILCVGHRKEIYRKLRRL